MANLIVNGVCRLTRDAEPRSTSNGIWYGFTIATFRKEQKEGRQSADFFDAEIYSKNTSIELEKNLVKGRLMYIGSGYLRNDKFIGKDGKEKSWVKIIISVYEFLNERVAEKEDLAPPLSIKQATNIAKSIHPSKLPPPPGTYINEEEPEKGPIEEYPDWVIRG